VQAEAVVERQVLLVLAVLVVAVTVEQIQMEAMEQLILVVVEADIKCLAIHLLVVMRLVEVVL
jgi:hypothetical protein